MPQARPGRVPYDELDEAEDYSPEKPRQEKTHRRQAPIHPPLFTTSQEAGPSNFPHRQVKEDTYIPRGNGHRQQYYTQQTQGPPLANSEPDPYAVAEALRIKLVQKDAELKRMNKLNETFGAMELEQKDDAPKSKKKKSKDEEPSSGTKSEEFGKRVGDLARRCSMMNLLFVSAEHFMQQRPTVKTANGSVPMPLDDPRTLNTDASRELRISAVIYDETPEDLKRDFLRNPRFKEVFSHCFNAGRRSIISNWRHNVAPKVWPQDTAMFFKKADRANYRPFRVRLYENPDAEKPRFSTYAPFFYPDALRRPEDFLKVRQLGLVMRGLLFGPSAVEAPKAKPAHGTNGRNWGITRITPAFLALAATVSVFGHTGDEHLTPDQNPGSKIRYHYLYDKLIRLILAKFKERPKAAEALFKFHNRIVFAGLAVKGKDSGEEDEDNEEDESSSGMEEGLGHSDLDTDEELDGRRRSTRRDEDFSEAEASDKHSRIPVAKKSVDFGDRHKPPPPLPSMEEDESLPAPEPTREKGKGKAVNYSDLEEDDNNSACCLDLSEEGEGTCSSSSGDKEPEDQVVPAKKPSQIRKPAKPTPKNPAYQERQPAADSIEAVPPPRNAPKHQAARKNANETSDDEDEDWPCVPATPLKRVPKAKGGKAGGAKAKKGAIDEDEDEDWLCVPAASKAVPKPKGGKAGGAKAKKSVVAENRAYEDEGGGIEDDRAEFNGPVDAEDLGSGLGSEKGPKPSGGLTKKKPSVAGPGPTHKTGKELAMIGEEEYLDAAQEEVETEVGEKASGKKAKGSGGKRGRKKKVVQPEDEEQGGNAATQADREILTIRLPATKTAAKSGKSKPKKSQDDADADTPAPVKRKSPRNHT